MRHLVFYSLLLLLYWVQSAILVNGNTSVSTFYPFLSQEGADPWVLKHPTDGFYYATKSTQINVVIWRSRCLSTLDIGESRVIWVPKNNTISCRDIWAPELHFVHQKWYVYFAATTCDGDNANHRMFVLENANEDPFQGEFHLHGQLTDSTNKWAIDGTAFEHPLTHDLYYIWSGWEGNTDVMQILYIAHMSDPHTIDSERVEIARPRYAWEINHTPTVNEGPEVVIHGRTINLIFSASGSWTNDYSMGLITADINADPMEPTSWRKRANPILTSGNGLFGPGHGSLTSDNWLIFHTAAYDGSGWTRQIRIQPFSWNEDDGTPILGELRDPNIPLPLPPGEPQRQRYQFDLPTQNATFEIELNKTEHFIMATQVRSTERPRSTHYLLSINQKEIHSIDVLYSDNWSSMLIPVKLSRGKNTLLFSNLGTTMGEIHSIDLFTEKKLSFY